MSNLKQIPFDLEKAQNGAKIVTRSGANARLLGVINAKNFNVVVATENGDHEVVDTFKATGQYANCPITSKDLFLLVEPSFEMVSFDLKYYLEHPNTPIYTRDSNFPDVEILKTDLKGEYPIVVCVDKSQISVRKSDGKIFRFESNRNDLYMKVEKY